MSWFFDPAVPGSVVSIVAAFLSPFALDRSRWDARTTARARERDRIRPYWKALYRRRPRGADLYQFIPSLALRHSVPSRPVRLAARATRLLDSPDVVRAQGFALAETWIATVGEFAVAMQRDQQDLRRFYQTNHLAIIRDGVVAMTIVLAMSHRGRLKPEQRTTALWGITLVEGAARYNSLAPQQRQAVFVAVPGYEEPFGPLVQAPSSWKRPLLWARNTLGGGLYLRRRDFDQAHATFVAAERLMNAFD